MKQSTTLDEQYGSYQSDGDLSGSYSLDDIPEEMEEEEGHKKAVALNSKYVHNEDEEEDLRSSQMHERPTSSQHARSNNSDKDLPLEPADAGQPDAGKAPHPSPASGMSKFGAASSDEDPRLARSALKTLHKSHTSPNPIADIDTR